MSKELEPEVTTYLREVWELLYTSEHPTEPVCWAASELCNRIVAIDPRCTAAWVLKSQVILQLGDAGAALSAATMALKYGPEQAECHYVHAAALFQLGRSLDALRAVTRAFHCTSPRANDSLLEGLCYQRAVILRALGRCVEAVETLNAGLERYPNSELLKTAMSTLRRAKQRHKLVVLSGKSPAAAPTRAPVEGAEDPPAGNRPPAEPVGPQR